MRSGTLRYPITIVLPTKAPDGQGGSAGKADAVILSTRAGKRDPVQRETYTAQQRAGVATAVFFIRSHPAQAQITNAMEVIESTPRGDRRYRVLGVVDPKPNNPGYHLDLTCEERL